MFFLYTYNKKLETKKGAIGAFKGYLIKNYFLFTKKDAIRTNTTSPTNPPLPKPATRAVKLAITSIPNTVPPVKTCQRIVTGIVAKNSVAKPPKNPVTNENAFSMIFVFN